MNTKLKHGYQIIVLCRVGHSTAVKEIVGEQLATAGLTLDEISDQVDTYQRLARVVARVRCTITERSTLVGLVRRLEREPAVRSVRWENLSEKESS